MTHNADRISATTRRNSLIALAGIALTAPVAQAHHAMDGATPTNLFEGFLSGLAHPVIGVDHFAFLVVAALMAFTLNGKARYLVPLAFVGATVAGTLYHLTAADLPLVETVIALSVLLGGVAVLLKHSVSALLMGALFAVIGVFHGYAYGESIVGAEQTPLLAYLAGFALIQFAIIAAAVKGLSMIAQHSQRAQRLTRSTGGLFAAATGAAFLAMNLS
ncbi:HupE/UreJ family protein [Thiosocius teredinicola]|uniref:HupE/UreJ family protein n=1 Tax=Thiosocius teredinicola TaxID=1973002 RepID=UPI0009911875